MINRCYLQTDRLILKPTLKQDFDNILMLRQDPDVQKYTRQGVQSGKDIQRFIDIIVPYQEKHGFGMSSIFLKNSGVFIGQAGIFHIGHYDQQPEIELGYRFCKKYWGSGYATEISRALVFWARENVIAKELIAFVYSENKRSIRVLEKVGFSDLG